MSAEIYDNTDLFECLDYFEENNDIEPLQFAIKYNSNTFRQAIQQTKELLDYSEQSENYFLKNKLEKLLITLKR